MSILKAAGTTSSLLLVLVCAQPLRSQTIGNGILTISPDKDTTSPGSILTLSGSGLPTDTIVYIGGLEARETKFVNSSTLQVTTPYLRPGTYTLQLRSGSAVMETGVQFTALPVEVDSSIDRAVALADANNLSNAILILKPIAENNPDYQVRAFAHYELGQFYFQQGDWWHWAGESADVTLDADKAGRAVQTYWRYYLSFARSSYLLQENQNPNFDLTIADYIVAKDVTQNAEPRFYRGLVNARFGNLSKAMADSVVALKTDPNNSSYRALQAYVAALGGDKSKLEAFSGETVTDSRALELLGEAAYASGDSAGAQKWWVQAGQIDPQGASLAYLVGRKHLNHGHQRVAEALLKEATVMVPNTKVAGDAQQLLSSIQH